SPGTSSLLTGTCTLLAFRSTCPHCSHLKPLFVPADFNRLRQIQSGFTTSNTSATEITERYSTLSTLGCLVVPLRTPQPISILSPGSSMRAVLLSSVGSYTAATIWQPFCATEKNT